MKYVIFEMENGDIMKGELYPEIAPKSVENFVKLVESGFYDGLIFHRVIPGFMIQGGCPNGNGMGGPGWTIEGEFEMNGFKNDLKHTRGVLSMARAMDPNSAGSQFFIMVEDAPHLDGQYAAFGKIADFKPGITIDERMYNDGEEIAAFAEIYNPLDFEKEKYSLKTVGRREAYRL